MCLANITRKKQKIDKHNFLQISKGFNAFLVMCSLRPEYNERVLFAQALAPLIELRGYVKFALEDVKKVMKYIKVILKNNKN